MLKIIRCWHFQHIFAWVFFNFLLLPHTVVISVGLLLFLRDSHIESQGRINPEQTRVKRLFIIIIFIIFLCTMSIVWKWDSHSFLNYRHRINFSSFILASMLFYLLYIIPCLRYGGNLLIKAYETSAWCVSRQKRARVMYLRSHFLCCFCIKKNLYENILSNAITAY